MDASAWKTVCEWIQNSAIVIAAFATLGGLYFGKRVEAAKEKKESERQAAEDRDRGELLERAKTAESETKGIRTFLNERYPGVGTPEALERLRQEIREVRSVATRGDFREPAPDLHTSAVGRLRPLAAQAKGVTVQVFSQSPSHDPNRSRMIRTLASVLRGAGLDASEGAETLEFGAPFRSPIALCAHPAQAALAQELISALASLIASPIAKTVDPQCPEGRMVIRVSGVPEFAQDGVIRFR
jgi:hypothetical protein